MVNVATLFYSYYIYIFPISNNLNSYFVSIIAILFLFLRQNLYHMEKAEDYGKKAATSLYLTKENAAELEAYCERTGIKKKDFIAICLRYINYHGIDLSESVMILQEQDRLNLPALKCEVQDAVSVIKKLPGDIAKQFLEMANNVRMTAIKDNEVHNAITAAKEYQQRMQTAEDSYQKVKTDNILLTDKVERTEEWLQASEEALKQAKLEIKNLSMSKNRLIFALRTTLAELKRATSIFRKPNQTIIAEVESLIAEVGDSSI